jgi:pantoate--beta-alanine ligase
LDKNGFNTASKIYFYLSNVKKSIKKKLSNIKTINIKKNLMKLGVQKVEYIEFFNLNTLKKPKNKKEKFKIFIAYYLNNIRLIDNI